MSRRTGGLAALALALALALPMQALAAPSGTAGSGSDAAGPTATVTVDPDTRDNWRSWAAGGGTETRVSTEDVGRIWTDKTVEAAGEDDGSDFLTTLSVISSTSDTTVSKSSPLDIVLVIDASGSMSDAMGRWDSTYRIDALKKAANSFIDLIAKNNEGVAPERQHQVAIVKFAGNKTDKVGNDTYRSQGYTYNYSQVMERLTACDETGAARLKADINAISPAGATRADYGLQLAQGLSSGRSDAKKVVVFLTDGSPTSSRDFEDGVARSAVDSAKAMKDAGAAVYSIGIFSGADPTADPTSIWTSDENRFMHAVSSNYPGATSYTSDSLGTRAQGSDYYESASTADDLQKVFEGISSSITTGAGFPTHVEEGFGAHESGYVTFTDELGDWMQVDEFRSAQINGKTYDVASKSTNGNVDTYQFSGEAANLVVTVERAGEGDPQTGDKVTVKVPASLIPLRTYKIDLAAGTFEVSSIEDISPLRVTYASSVKSVARDNLFTPENVPGLSDYIESNLNREDNTVSFLANKWEGRETGDTVATFTPAATNRYYYFQQDVPIYTDEACTQRATRMPSGDETYYAKQTFYVRGEDGKPQETTHVASFKGSDIASKDSLVADSEGYAFKAGTPCESFIDQLHTDKASVGGNSTGTARDVLNPSWDVADGLVQSHLGNNGRISFSLDQTPATLDTKASFALAKELRGRDWTDADAFTFRIALDAARSDDPNGQTLSKSSVTVTSADVTDGRAAIDFGTITFTKAGTYVYEVWEEAGDLPGISYSTNWAKVTVVVTADRAGNLSASVSKVENPLFTNTYTSELSYSAAGGLVITKVLNGRDMAEGQFSFTVTPADAKSAQALGLTEGANVLSAPAASDGATSTVDVLGGRDVTFTQADAGKTFSYSVAERDGGAAGYTYDTAVRTVTIAVADDGDGTLTVTTTVSGGPEGTKTYTYSTGEQSAAPATVPFVNSYRASTDNPGGSKATIPATKKMVGRPLADGEFTFHLAYLNDSGKTPIKTVQNNGSNVDFGELSYDTETLRSLARQLLAIEDKTDDGKPCWDVFYLAYEDTTDLPSGVTATTSSWAVRVRVVDNGDGSLTATAMTNGNTVEFRNTYSTGEPVSVQLNGEKLLSAPSGLEPADITGKFTFEVTGEDGAPMPEPTQVTNDADGNVDFGTISFSLEDLNRALGADGVAADGSRSHTFTYTVTESGSAAGVTNDPEKTRTVSFTVTDDGAGHLSVTRNPEKGAAFTFTNSYDVTPVPSSVTDQIHVTKQLQGRDLVAGEFTFELLEGDSVVATGTNDAAGNVTMGAITYAEPGTHTYTLRERGAGTFADGVRYDGATYTVVTNVTDNGDGTLSVTHALSGSTDATFTNAYGFNPASVKLEATKVLEGRDLLDGEFGFTLQGQGEAGGTRQTVRNDGRGNVSFDTLTFDAPGTYVYQVTEDGGSAEGVTYDQTVYTVTVSVADDGQGQLEASVAIERDGEPVDAMTFTNTYAGSEVPPTPGTPDEPGGPTSGGQGILPETGDQLATAFVVLALAAAGVGILARVRGRR